MIKAFNVVSGVAEANTYILYDESNDAIVIDPSEPNGEIPNALARHGLRCKYVLLTHAHVDHCNGVRSLQDSGAIVYMHKDDEPLLNAENSLATAFGVPYNAFKPDIYVTSERKLFMLGQEIVVLHTPGHTAGSCCYLIDDRLYTGDTLFYMSVGRTDFPTGSYSSLCDSVHGLYGLGSDYTVMPGHGPSTTIFFERDNNPYV